MIFIFSIIASLQCSVNSLRYSKVTQSHTHIHILFPTLSPIVFHPKWLDIVPSAIQQDKSALKFHVWELYMRAGLKASVTTASLLQNEGFATLFLVFPCSSLEASQRCPHSNPQNLWTGCVHWPKGLCRCDWGHRSRDNLKIVLDSKWSQSNQMSAVVPPLSMGDTV